MEPARPTTLDRRQPALALGYWLLLTTALTLALVAPRWTYYGAPELIETGDAAVNALDIEDARHGDELLGNYSRWGFHHPGPAFFYVYAFGETVLREWLRLEISPHGAHVVASIALQVGFFAAGLLLLATGLRRRWFLPLALATSLIAFLTGSPPFLSIWPPHVILLPYFCLIAACSAMAAGHGRALLVAVIATCFLVHGHVAQPLLAVPLFSVAWLLLARRTRRRVSGPWLLSPVRAYPLAHAAAALIVALAVLPLALDMARGEASNFARILEHVRAYSGDWRGPVESLLFLLSFAVMQTEIGDAAWPGPQMILRGWPWMLALVVAVGAAVATVVRQRRQHDSDAASSSFVRSWALMIVIAIALAFVWTLRQSGGHEPFNNFYAHGIAVHGLLLGVWAMSSALQHFGPRWLPRAALALPLALPLLIPPLPGRPAAEPHLYALGVRQAAQTDPAPERIKILAFQHHDWPLAAIAATTLKRMRRPFAVSTEWQHMYGVPPSGASIAQLLCEERADVWWLACEEDQPGGSPIERLGAHPYWRSPRPVDPNVGWNLDATVPDAVLPFLAGGIRLGGSPAWSAAREVVLVMQSTAPARQALDVHVIATPFLLPERGVHAQRAHLQVNGVEVGTASLASRGDARFRVAAEVWNRRERVVMTFALPDAISPVAAGLPGDQRLLGWGFESLRVAPASEHGPTPPNAGEPTRGR